jgi:hypothetical protein
VGKPRAATGTPHFYNRLATPKADESALLVSFLSMVLQDNQLDQRVVLPLSCKPPASANHSHVPTALAAGIMVSNDGRAALEYYRSSDQTTSLSKRKMQS